LVKDALNPAFGKGEFAGAAFKGAADNIL